MWKKITSVTISPNLISFILNFYYTSVPVEKCDTRHIPKQSNKCDNNRVFKLFMFYRWLRGLLWHGSHPVRRPHSRLLFYATSRWSHFLRATGFEAGRGPALPSHWLPRLFGCQWFALRGVAMVGTGKRLRPRKRYNVTVTCYSFHHFLSWNC